MTQDDLAPLLSASEPSKPDVVEQWVQQVYARQATWDKLKQEFKGSGQTLRAILDGLIRRWIAQHGRRPTGNDLAPLLGVTRNHLSQILHQAGLELREYKV